MKGPLARHLRSIVRWSAGGAVVGVLIGLTIVLIDAGWYAVQPEPAAVTSVWAIRPGSVVQGCEEVTYRAVVGSRPAGMNRVVTFEGCTGDHAIGESVEIRQRGDHVAIDIASPLGAVSRIALIALVLGALGALLAVRDTVLWALVMIPVALFRRARKR